MMRKSSSETKLPCWDKYHFFTDNSMNNRVALAQNMRRAKGGRPPEAPPRHEEPSVRTTAGWDKYYFFSVPADASIVGATAKLGRSRPAAVGPRSFALDSFTQDDLNKAATKLE